MIIDEIKRTAVAAARQAGALIKEKSGKSTTQTLKSNAFDLVTEVDKECEQLIRAYVQKSFPDHSILGEEAVEPGSYASEQAVKQMQYAEYLWVIDPIDGTTNFIHGFPASVVSIGIAHQGVLIAGVIYDPYRDELFTAGREQGACLNGQRIQVSGEAALQQSILATGLPTATQARSTNMVGLASLAHHIRAVRSVGSAALHMAYVAAGRLSGFWEIDLNAWDLSAGSLLVQEAGGRVTDTKGEDYHLGVRHIVATNGRIHSELLHVLNEWNATGYEETEQ
ncbi:MAG: myo-inositol-monophosphatase [Bacilli bacterium]|nr:myo-inositol-monophosphatase [Bacilli bacterium]